VTTFTGDGLAGNVGLLGEGVLDHPGWTETSIAGSTIRNGVEQHALVRVFSCRAASACWSDAISPSASG
jgi:hypothetical protein